MVLTTVEPKFTLSEVHFQIYSGFGGPRGLFLVIRDHFLLFGESFTTRLLFGNCSHDQIEHGQPHSLSKDLPARKIITDARPRYTAHRDRGDASAIDRSRVPNDPLFFDSILL